MLRIATSGLTAQQRVLAGIAFLDKNAEGWRSKINPDTLDIQFDCTCAVAQVFGSYNANVGRGRLLESHKKAADLGFYAYNHMNEGADAEYAVLTKAWLDILAAENAVRTLMQRVSGTACAARRAVA